MSFDQLKREAVTLERQLEDKVSRYQQLAQKLNQNSLSSTNSGDLSRAELGGGSNTALAGWDEEAALQQEVNRLLNHLQDVIHNQLSRSATTNSQEATVNRYREIVQDLSADVSKSQLLVRRAKERRELMGSAGPAGAAGGSGAMDPNMEHLLRERNHIHGSMNAAASVLGQAEAVRADLRTQGRSLRNAGTLLGQLATNIPGMNHLIEQIRRRRSRDDMVVAGVIAACILFTLWYLFS